MPQLAESADEGKETIAKNLAQRWDLLRIPGKPRMLILGSFSCFGWCDQQKSRKDSVAGVLIETLSGD